MGYTYYITSHSPVHISAVAIVPTPQRLRVTCTSALPFRLPHTVWPAEHGAGFLRVQAQDGAGGGARGRQVQAALPGQAPHPVPRLHDDLREGRGGGSDPAQRESQRPQQIREPVTLRALCYVECMTVQWGAGGGPCITVWRYLIHTHRRTRWGMGPSIRPPPSVTSSSCRVTDQHCRGDSLECGWTWGVCVCFTEVNLL